MVDGFLARLIVTHAYSFASRDSAGPHRPASAPLECSLTSPDKSGDHSFGSVFNARVLSTPGRLTSELLRTL
jgi:hypothetical protein